MASSIVTEHCSLCIYMIENSPENHRLTMDHCFKAFHEHCPRCAAYGASALLCSFCNHLRIRHWFLCKEFMFSSANQLLGKIVPYIPMGSLAEIASRSQCLFCQMLIRGKEIDERPSMSISPDQMVMFKSVGSDAYNPKRITRPFANRWCGFEVGPLENFNFKFDEIHSQEQYQHISSRSLSQHVQHVPPMHSDGSKMSDIIYRIRNWLSRCLSHHKLCNSEIALDLPSNFRVIDVRSRRIVRTRPGCRFVALSYVWGATPQSASLHATRSTIQYLKEPGALAPGILPRTIEDALYLCDRLGEEYLWVDALCIIQDDEQEKLPQLQAMGNIYASAVLVIVAAYGENSHSGLPGVSQEIQHPIELVLPDLYVTNKVPGFASIIKETKWATRGWTYQEVVLAKRRLYCTQTQLIFECEEEILHQSGQDDLLDKREGLPLEMDYTGRSRASSLREEHETAFEAYFRHLSVYTNRNLTYKSDVYNAFSAILTGLFAARGHVYGLPIGCFDEAILWRPEDVFYDQARHGPPKSIVQNDEIVLPTWTWASVDTCVSRPGRQMIGTLASWSLPERNGKLIACDSPGMWLLDDDASEGQSVAPLCVYIAIAWAEGCFERPSALPHWRQTPFRDIELQLRTRWPTYASFWQEAFGNHKPQEPHHAAMPGILLVRAQVATLRLAPAQRIQYDCGIINNENQVVGLLRAEHPRVDPNVYSRLASSGALFEFLALSLSVFDDEDIEDFDNDENSSGDEDDFPEGSNSEDEYDFRSKSNRDGKARRTIHGLLLADQECTYRDTSGNSLLPTVKVMLIRREEGIAYRVSTGWIFLTAWAKTRPEFQSLYLG